MAKEKIERMIGIQSIGKLEATVFKMVCDNPGGTTVREIYEQMRKKRQIAYTTVLSVMNSLAEKGLLAQDKSAMAYMYKPTMTNEKLATDIIKVVIDKLLDGKIEPVLSRFTSEKK